MKKNNKCLLILVGFSVILLGIVSCNGDSGSGENHYTLGGKVIGLDVGQSVLLANNSNRKDSVIISKNGPFHFKHTLAKDSKYAVTVLTQPKDEICTVNHGEGSGVVANVNNIQVVCSHDRYTIGGTVSGLISGKTVRLMNNGDVNDNVVIVADGHFVFKTPVAKGGNYNVTVRNQPQGQVCSVTNGTGYKVDTNINNINVVCSADKYTVSGTVSGLNGNQQVTLINNGDHKDSVIVKQNGMFAFANPVARGGDYNVTVANQPVNGICTINNGSGKDITKDISDVSVNCSWVHSFGKLPDGHRPAAGLTKVTDDSFFGTTFNGGEYNNGTMFKVTDQGVEKVLYSFGKGGESSTDAIAPSGAMVFDNNGYLYGSSTFGGLNGGGAIYKIQTNGQGEKVIHSYQFLDFSEDVNELVFNSANNLLYGTTVYGGDNGSGDIFSLTLDGSNYNVLYSFTPQIFGFTCGVFQKDVGACPQTKLTFDNNGSLYGGTTSGGEDGIGTIFKMTSTGVVSVIHQFSVPYATEQGDSVSPNALAYDKNNDVFYGTTQDMDGKFFGGEVFSITPSGVKKIIYSFGESGRSDGYNSNGVIIGSDGNLYGTTQYGGLYDQGTIYKMTPQGVETILYSFGATSTDGQQPVGRLIEGKNGILYGTSSLGGNASGGTVFSIKAIYK